MNTIDDTNKLVLVVDDDPSVRLMMGSVLESLGMYVEEAKDGEQALLFLENVVPDLLLLDVMMPGLDGFAVCERMRQVPAISEIPIVMVTGSNDTFSIQRAYDLGVADFIAKPIPWASIGYRINFIMRAIKAFSDLKKNEMRLSHAQRIAGMGTWEWELKTDKMWFSDEVLQLFQYDPQGFDASFQSFINTVHPADRERVLSATSNAINSTSSYSIDHQLQLCDGRLCFVHTEATVVTDCYGMPIRLEGSIQDISERKVAEDQIRQLAFFDMLTGLPNRVLFMDHLGRIHHKAQIDNKKYAILFIDIDGFKCINDTLGHLCGDLLLQQLALRLKDSVRSDDFASTGMVARLGGDEFVVLIDHLKNIEDVAIIAQRIIVNFSIPAQLDAAEVVVTASIGISIFPDDGHDTETMIRHADIAMYSAKDNGKNSFQYFSRSMHDAASFQLELEKELRMAIHSDEFTMHYQPKVDLATKRIVGFEALIRWNNRRLGNVLPVIFIPMAEKNNLIWDVDRWVIREVCRQIGVWQGNGMNGFTVAINLSGKSLTHKNLVAFIRQETEKHKIAPQSIQIEITEGVMMLGSAVSAAALDELKEMGISFAIDDFGTGYSSLQYLHNLSVETIKIDRSFVATISDVNEKSPVITAIIALAQSLGLSIVAEGIEHDVQCDFLRTQGCSQGQGYLYSYPVPAEEVPTLIELSNTRQ